MKKIVSFGDSFIFGSELTNNLDGSKAWPGLIAKELGCAYETRAIPGCGNDSIAQQIYSYFSENPTTDVLAVIQWTWSMRWDFYLPNADAWVNLGPTCVPSKIKHYIDTKEAERLINFYKDYVSESMLWNIYRSLQTIYAAQNFIKQKNIKAIQTYIDHELFFPNLQRSKIEHYNAIKDPSWPNVNTEEDFNFLPEKIKQEVNENYINDHSANYIKLLRELTCDQLQTFEGNTFLDWSVKNNFKITPPPGDHPLEQAHEAAKNLWIVLYAKELNIKI